MGPRPWWKEIGNGWKGGGETCPAAKRSPLVKKNEIEGPKNGTPGIRAKTTLGAPEKIGGLFP